MNNLFHIDIVTPEKLVYSAEIASLIVPAYLGYLGVLANHAPFVARLVGGKIILKDGLGNAKIFNSQSRGFIEVLKNRATIILDAAIE